MIDVEEILSGNVFIEWSANILRSIRGLFCVFFNFFYCWLAFVFGENLWVADII